MTLFCPRCGAEFAEEWRGPGLVTQAVRCSDCGLTVGDPPPMLAVGPEDEEVEYGMAEWPVSDRGAATASLVDAEISYRWEADLVLIVPAVAEDEVDRLLDEIEDGDPSSDGEGGLPPVGDLAAEEAEGGEEVQAAMADLFVASDRLQHAPADPDVAADVNLSAALVRASSPPYGIERPVWRQIQALASTLVGDLEESADEELVAADARAVRDFLRDYV